MTDWYAELTGPVPSDLPFARRGFVQGFFGDWSAERLASDLLRQFRRGDRAWRTDHQLSRHKPLPAGSPQGEVYHHPHPDCGLAMTFLLDGSHTSLPVMVSPYAQMGTQHSVRLRRAHVRADGVSAALEGDLLLDDPAISGGNPFPIVFIDAGFVHDRGFYSAGLVNDYILYGFVSALRVGRPRPVSWKVADWMRDAGIVLPDGAEFIPLDTSELAALMWRSEDRTIYDFRGRIEQVWPVGGARNWAGPGGSREDRIFGARVWRVRTLVMREPDMMLDLYVSDLAGGDEAWLCPGTWIEGVATLGGYCWY